MPFVCIKLFLIASQLDALVTPRARHGDSHGLPEELEALNLGDSLLGVLWLLEDNECLALALDIFLGDDIRDGTELGEDGSEGLGQRLELDALFQILDVDPMSRSAHIAGTCRVCNDTYVATGDSEDSIIAMEREAMLYAQCSCVEGGCGQFL